MLEQLDENQEVNEADRRMQIKVVGEINQFLKLIPQRREEKFLEKTNSEQYGRVESTKGSSSKSH
jgi:hypothetical protein